MHRSATASEMDHVLTLYMGALCAGKLTCAIQLGHSIAPVMLTIQSLPCHYFSP